MNRNISISLIHNADQKELKYVIREWDPNHEKMGKGVTLTMAELVRFKELLDGMELVGIIQTVAVPIVIRH